MNNINYLIMRNTLKYFIVFLIISGATLYSCSKDNDLMNLEEQSSLTISKDVFLTNIELLGKRIFFDKISVPHNMSCADCHGGRVGFTGPKAGINIHGAVYPGAVAQRFGNRKPPSAAYATFSPVLYFDATTGSFFGGNFWDGRATGEILGNPSADQALGPFLNPVEHNVPNKQTVLEMISRAKYKSLWGLVWGEPLEYTNPIDIDRNYDRVGLAIAAFESSSEVNQFNSKFDYYRQGEVELSSEELIGLNLFNINCAQCHTSAGSQPLFTNFSYDNIGVPINPENPVYDYDPDFVDFGLGGFLETRPDLAPMAGDNLGKHKVPTLRNVDKRPGNFKKAYMHNGVFKSLKEVVHFYNTRDVEPWPEPEVSINVNTDELGNLGLSDTEEDAIVAFLKTLSDGYRL
jgi:cytochrome c peroxidase